MLVVAGFSVASRIETMFAMVIWALSMSVAPFVGQNWGAKYFKESLDRCVWEFIRLSLGRFFLLSSYCAWALRYITGQ